MLIRSRFQKNSRVCLDTFEPSKTQQHMSIECDINEIIRKAKNGQVIPDDGRRPSFGDFGDLEDYQSSLNHVIDAQAAFNNLASNIRDRFNNDPSRLLAFVSNEKNRDEAIKLGLIEMPEPEIKPEPVLVKMAPEEPKAQLPT